MIVALALVLGLSAPASLPECVDQVEAGVAKADRAGAPHAQAANFLVGAEAKSLDECLVAWNSVQARLRNITVARDVLPEPDTVAVDVGIRLLPVDVRPL